MVQMIRTIRHTRTVREVRSCMKTLHSYCSYYSYHTYFRTLVWLAQFVLYESTNKKLFFFSKGNKCRVGFVGLAQKNLFIYEKKNQKTGFADTVFSSSRQARHLAEGEPIDFGAVKVTNGLVTPLRSEL